MIIDDNQLLPALNISNTTKFGKQHKQPLLAIVQIGYCYIASSYLSIGHSTITSLQIAEIVKASFLSKQKSFNMRIAMKKAKMRTPLVNPFIDLARSLGKVLKKGEYIVIKCHNIPHFFLETLEDFFFFLWVPSFPP